MLFPDGPIHQSFVTLYPWPIPTAVTAMILYSLYPPHAIQAHWTPFSLSASSSGSPHSPSPMLSALPALSSLCSHPLALAAPCSCSSVWPSASVYIEILAPSFSLPSVLCPPCSCSWLLALPLLLSSLRHASCYTGRKPLLSLLSALPAFPQSSPPALLCLTLSCGHLSC